MDYQRLQAAYERAKRDLLDARGAHGHWEGELASSALATATAVSALAIVRRDSTQTSSAAELQGMIDVGVKYLADQQNEDGGFGDTDKSLSNIATTLLVIAALHLAEREREAPAEPLSGHGSAGASPSRKSPSRKSPSRNSAGHAELLAKAQRYVDQQGGLAGLRKRYGIDKTFVVPIMTNLALAGLCDWKEISPLPFELACIPQSWYRFAQMPVVSYAIPALVAIGQAHYFHRKPWNPYSRIVRGLSIGPSLKVLRRMQPESGGYLEATPLTSFVVMSLAATGRADHEVTQEGVKFIRNSMRADGSWPIDTNLATWVTSLSINALGPESIGEIDDQCWEWLLSCQHYRRHPFTGADPGGWGWTDLSGAVPDADDTPGALLTLATRFQNTEVTSIEADRILEQADAGVNWLLKLQNRDGGWPTFCRGWGKLPFDRSGTDLTAHAIRALSAWLPMAGRMVFDDRPFSVIRQPTQMLEAIDRGFKFLFKKQHRDGSWSPLWFGNQHHPEEDNPIYGTAKVLLAFRDRRVMQNGHRGAQWLAKNQNPDGSFGQSVEETALAVEGLLCWPDRATYQDAIDRGLTWLVERVEQNQHTTCSPIGFYFAKLWYYERLYPLIFTVGTLRQALSRYRAESAHPPAP